MQFDIWMCEILDCCCQLCENSSGHWKIYPKSYGFVTKEASEVMGILLPFNYSCCFRMCFFFFFLTFSLGFVCLYFRMGTFKCATMEEIEAEKSLIEKNVVSLLAKSSVILICVKLGFLWSFFIFSSFRIVQNYCLIYISGYYSERKNGKDY